MNKFLPALKLKIPHKRFLAVLCLIVSILLSGFVVSGGQKAYAQCPDCRVEIRDHHKRLRDDVNRNTSEKLNTHKNWFLNTFFKDQFLPALMLMTEQLSAVAMQQTMVIGTFFDAKHQLETQRLFQELQTQAHKDYQPSEDFCWFGTNVRSLANSESKGRFNAYMLSRRQMARHLGSTKYRWGPQPQQ